MREYLKKLRCERGFTQQDMADYIGIKPNHYCMIEQGNRRKRLDLLTAVKIAEKLNVSVKHIADKEKELFGTEEIKR